MTVIQQLTLQVSADKVVVAVDGAKEVDLPERLRLCVGLGIHLALDNTVLAQGQSS
jgi:hypothetical protein